jgi:dienelactone hydrolase
MNMPVNLTGDHAYDSSLTAPLPIVVVIPTWTGLGEYMMQRVEMLAELGYYAFAADIYGPNFPADAGENEWGEFATIYFSNTSLYVNRIQARIMKAKEEQWGDASKVAAIGYCFGGTGALLC